MGRSKRSKNNKINMKNRDKRSDDYKTKAQLKKERKELKKQAQMEKKFLIGFYDDYRKDGLLNSILNKTSCKLVGSYTTEPIYTMYDLGGVDGCVVKDDGTNSIKIEVWEIPETMIIKVEGGYNYYAELDTYNQDYSRKKVVSPFGEIMMYIYTDECDSNLTVLSGDWIDHLSYKRVFGTKKIEVNNIVDADE